MRKAIFLVIGALVIGGGLSFFKKSSDEPMTLSDIPNFSPEKARFEIENLSAEIEQQILDIKRRILKIKRSYDQVRTKLPQPDKFKLSNGIIKYWSQWSFTGSNFPVKEVSGVNDEGTSQFGSSTEAETLKNIRKQLEFALDHRKNLHLFTYNNHFGLAVETENRGYKTYLTALFDPSFILDPIERKFPDLTVTTLHGDFIKNVATTSTEDLGEILQNNKVSYFDLRQAKEGTLFQIYKDKEGGFALVRKHRFDTQSTNSDQIKDGMNKIAYGKLLLIFGVGSILFLMLSRRKKTDLAQKPRVIQQRKMNRIPSARPSVAHPPIGRPSKVAPIPRGGLLPANVIDSIEAFQTSRSYRTAYQVAHEFERRMMHLKESSLVNSMFAQSVAMIAESPTLFFKFYPENGVARLDTDAGFETGRAPALLSFNIPAGAVTQLCECVHRGKLASLSTFPPLAQILLNRLGIACFEAWAVTTQPTNKESTTHLIGILVILHSGVKSTIHRDLIVRMMRTIGDVYGPQEKKKPEYTDPSGPQLHRTPGQSPS